MRCVVDVLKAPEKNDRLEKLEQKERIYCTVYSENSNIGQLLVENGFARVQTVRENERCSGDYELLLNAEQKAKQRSLGLYSSGNPPLYRVTDLSHQVVKNKDEKQGQKPAVDLAKVKQFLPNFLRAGQLTAIVEYVHSASKFKVYIASQNCILNFILSGIKVPTKGSNLDSFLEPSVEFAREWLHQRDVIIEVENSDNGGNFIGRLILDKESFAVILLREGFASLLPSASRLRYYNELLQTEELARKNKKNIWKNYTPEVQKQNDEQVEDASQTVRVLITEIKEAGTFYLQEANDLERLNDMNAQLQSIVPDASWTPVSGRICLGFYVDQWFRFKIFGKTERGEFTGYFIDYGEEASLKEDMLRSLPKEFAVIPPFAKESSLAFIKPPSITQDWGAEARQRFINLVTDKKLFAKLEYYEERRSCVMLGDPLSQVHINATLVREGLARVKAPRRLPQAQALIDILLEEEKKAQSENLGIWEYGEISDEEDEEKKLRQPRRRTHPNKR